LQLTATRAALRADMNYLRAADLLAPFSTWPHCWRWFRRAATRRRRSAAHRRAPTSGRSGSRSCSSAPPRGRRPADARSTTHRGQIRWLRSRLPDAAASPGATSGPGVA